MRTIHSNKVFYKEGKYKIVIFESHENRGGAAPSEYKTLFIEINKGKKVSFQDIEKEFCYFKDRYDITQSIVSIEKID